MDPEIYLIKYNYDPMGAYIKESRDLDERSKEKGEWMESYEWNYKTTYNEIVVFNEDLNRKIAEIANRFKNKNMSVLILVKEYPQGELIEKYLENGLFLTGKDTSKKRNVTIDMMRSRDLPVLVATTIADMGLDLPSLDVLIMAGGGGSDPTKFVDFKKKNIEKGKWDTGENNEDNRFGGVIEQRIGRVVRKHEDKKNAVIIDIWHSNKKMKKQSAARRKIYKDRNLNSKIVNLDELPWDKWQNEGTEIF
jgi:superfamily II DNA or RNA helicase